MQPNNGSERIIESEKSLALFLFDFCGGWAYVLFNRKITIYAALCQQIAGGSF